MWQAFKMATSFPQKGPMVKKGFFKVVILKFAQFCLPFTQQWLLFQPDSELKSESNESVNFIEKSDHRSCYVDDETIAIFAPRRIPSLSKSEIKRVGTFSKNGQRHKWPKCQVIIFSIFLIFFWIFMLGDIFLVKSQGI